jgi:hypothetical protein
MDTFIRDPNAVHEDRQEQSQGGFDLMSLFQSKSPEPRQDFMDNAGRFDIKKLMGSMFG